MNTTETNPWKPCDLRGVFPTAVSADLFERVGRAVGNEIELGSRVLVGGDFRLSTPELKSALIHGLASSGLRVIDAGQAPTPVHYFAASRLDTAAVFIVTASHNPASHNGLKWMVGAMPPTPDDILRVAAAAETRLFRSTAGAIEIVDPSPAYRDWILSNTPCRGDRFQQRIVLDPGNGAWSHLGTEVFQTLGFDAITIHATPDGNFPYRSPDCARTANLGALQAAVMANKASLGIAWDGDGDRVAFIDENGVHATTDEISILFARSYLNAATEGSPVVCDIKLSDSVRREVLAARGVPLLERSGHAFMRARILTNKAILGLDACGHYFFRDAGYRDDGLYSALALLRILAETGKSLAQLRRGLSPIHSTPELRLPQSAMSFDTVRDRFRNAFPHAHETNIDGARFTLEDGVVLARPSSTEAMVSLRIEGFSSQAYDLLLEQCLQALGEAGTSLHSQLGLTYK